MHVRSLCHRYLEGPLVQRPLLVPAVLHGMVSAAHEAGTQHVSRRGAFPCRDIRGPPRHLCSPPLYPIPGWGCPAAPCPQPYEGAAAAGAQALRVRRRNNLVSKLGLDRIAAEPQKLSGQKPQKLGMLLSRAH